MFRGFFIFFFPFWCILLNRFASNCNKQMEMSDKNISIITNTAAFCNKASNVLKQKCGVGDRRETYKLNPNKAISIIHHTGVCVRVCSTFNINFMIPSTCGYQLYRGALSYVHIFTLRCNENVSEKIGMCSKRKIIKSSCSD